MALSSERLPNKMLNGEEVLECIVSETRDMLKRDYAFLRTVAYRHVAFTVAVTVQFGQPHPNRTIESRVKPSEDGIVTGAPPMLPRRNCVCGWNGLESATVEGECPECGEKTTPDETSVVALEADVELDNPNLARVHHGLPVKVQQRETVTLKPPSVPLPGEPMPVVEQRQVVTKELRYDPKDYPAGKPPVYRDRSAEAAERIGVKKK